MTDWWKRGPHSPLCPQAFDRITMWTSGGGITAYIYYRSCLIRLTLLCPIAIRRKASPAHSLHNLIIHWCNLNKPKPLKSKEWTIRQESMRKFSAQTLFAFEYLNEFLERAKKRTTCATRCIPPHERWWQAMELERAGIVINRPHFQLCKYAKLKK